MYRYLVVVEQRTRFLLFCHHLYNRSIFNQHGIGSSNQVLLTSYNLGGQAARYVNGRKVVSSPTEDSRFRMIKQWLDYCNKNHNCQEKEPPILPTRVLDVRSKDPVLRVCQGRRDHYVALSYCWGGPQKATTTKETIEKYTKKVDLDELSQTLKDAIEITRRLNLQYLWIDALCIVQGGEDFNIESLKMAQYYGNAYFTLAAGCSACSGDGFLANRPSPLAIPCELDYYRYVDGLPTVSPLGSVFACLPSSKEVGPLETRAWTFQESILTRRMLLYGREQISFRCLERQTFENGTSFLHQQTVPYLNVRGQNLKPLAEQKLELLRRWYQMLELYTRRHMTNPADKLTALAGIAQVLHDTLKCKYIFGLWEDDMIRGMLWTTNTKHYSREWAKPLRRSVEVRAPSWSWASVEGHVTVDHLERTESKYRNPNNHRILIVGHEFEKSSFDPIRSMKPVSFELKVRGVLKGVQRGERQLSKYQPGGYQPGGSSYRSLHPKTILLEPVGMAPATGSGPNTHPVVIGLGLLDLPDEPLQCSFCMRLNIERGLILVSNTKGGYRRVGTFLVEDETWFENGDPEEIRLT